jgi:hypothetical protein
VILSFSSRHIKPSRRGGSHATSGKSSLLCIYLRVFLSGVVVQYTVFVHRMFCSGSHSHFFVLGVLYIKKALVENEYTSFQRKTGNCPPSKV